MKNFRIYAHINFNPIKTTKTNKKGKYIYYRGRHQSSSETRAKRKLAKKVMKTTDDNYERTTTGSASRQNITWVIFPHHVHLRLDRIKITFCENFLKAHGEGLFEGKIEYETRS